MYCKFAVMDIILYRSNHKRLFGIGSWKQAGYLAQIRVNAWVVGFPDQMKDSKMRQDTG